MTCEGAEHRTDTCLLLDRHIGSTGALCMQPEPHTPQSSETLQFKNTHRNRAILHYTGQKENILLNTRRKHLCHRQTQGSLERVTVQTVGIMRRRVPYTYCCSPGHLCTCLRTAKGGDSMAFYSQSHGQMIHFQIPTQGSFIVKSP